MIVFNIPHASTSIPSDLRSQFVLSEEALEAELLAMTDHFTDVLFRPCALGGESVVQADVSRLVVDTERFEDDAKEVMAARGMGVVYTRTSQGVPLRGHVTPTERESLLYSYYRPHHQRLTAAVTAALAAEGQATVIDCHSFPSVPLPYEVDQDRQRPDICIGTDEFHTPDSLSDALVQFFREQGYIVALNQPFAGSIVPMAYYGVEKRVRSVMIELNRGLYLDETDAQKKPAFAALSEDLQAASALLRELP